MSIGMARAEHQPDVRGARLQEHTDGLVIDFSLRAGALPHGPARLRLDLSRPGAALADEFSTWIEAKPMAWLFVCGAVCAPVLSLLGRRLDLRIGGAVLVAPSDWVAHGGRVALPLAPLAFPALLVRKGPSGNLPGPAARALAAAWSARAIDALPRENPLADRAVQELVSHRLASMPPPGPAPFSARLH